ncbi:hypothetical protein [Xanthomonas arboricola]|uniref:hypothetical protein n=1 Tax=Xanthomonas arboricola TaxID=56448 RepID=UPI0032E8B9BE
MSTKPVPANADGLVGVLFTAESHPGIRQVGTYKPGAVARVSASEAVRLVSAKRFQYASEADAIAAAEHLEQINVAALAGSSESAVGAPGQRAAATIAEQE